ncbi:MAG: hypothetical protein BAA04_08630 [Firmicutes bacterium ZCTH02-B6]|nr:MAG: hypothetical protein BAA04_08630 [Firmicutes bacterium ZCTH02-B6]
MREAQAAGLQGGPEERGTVAAGDGPGRPPEKRGVRTPQGTMVIVLIYAAATVLLWAYMYYHMLRYGGGLGGH